MKSLRDEIRPRRAKKADFIFIRSRRLRDFFFVDPKDFTASVSKPISFNVHTKIIRTFSSSESRSDYFSICVSKFQ